MSERSYEQTSDVSFLQTMEAFSLTHVGGGWDREQAGDGRR